MLKPGRTRDQHTMLVKKVTDAVAESLQVPGGEVTVVLAELHDHLVANNGRLSAEPVTVEREP